MRVPSSLEFLVLLGLGLVIIAGSTAAQMAPELVISGLSQPVRLVAPDEDDRLFVVEKTGKIRVFQANGVEIGTFLDLSGAISFGSEQGLLGLTFPPDHATTGRFYVNYTDTGGATRIARYRTTANPNEADTTSAQILLTVSQPFGNHNAGHLEFGPDGMLYIALGDGGSGGDPLNHAQNDQSLLGKMLRLDVSGPGAYAIPTDNPHTTTPPLDEIWAKGLRNPWCYSFDQMTGDLYIADVGQSELEEIDVQPAGSVGGENYGWRLMEGEECFDPGTGCNDGSLVLPVHQYSHGGQPFRCSISGGYVYRGTLIPEIQGLYFFADYCSDQIWSLRWTAAAGASRERDWTAQLTPPGGYGAVASFGQDGHGELYILDLNRGRVFRIVPSTTDVPPRAPTPYLNQNVPNPFNPATSFTYAAIAGRPHRVQVFGPDGRAVRTLVEGLAEPGPQLATWDGTDQSGRQVAGGVYVYRLEQDGEQWSHKMTLLK